MKAKFIKTEFKKLNPHICFYCGKEMKEENDLTIDHVIPVSKGGINITTNYVIACRFCNEEKKNLNIEDYLNEKTNTPEIVKLREKLLKEYWKNN